MSKPIMNRRIVAVKVADTINAIEGAPVSKYARELSPSWVKDVLTGMQMKLALLAEHLRIAEQERNNVSDIFLYEDLPILLKSLFFLIICAKKDDQ